MAKIIHQEVRKGPVPSFPTEPTIAPASYVVEDYTDVPVTIDDRMAEYETSKQFVEVAEKPPIEPEAKRKLESLIFMGRYTKEVEIAGHKFEFSTLTHRETKDIVDRLIQLGDVANNPMVVRVLTLANSIKSIDGAALDTIEISGEYATILERKAAVIDQLQLALVERLNAAYEALVKESDEVVYGETIKK